MDIVLIALLPVIFLIHDFEEIIFQSEWISKNGDRLIKQFPLLKKPVGQLQKISIRGFTVAVAEEFIIIGAVTIYTLISGNLLLWTAVFMAFSIHIVIHLLQFAVIRKYIPALVTSILCIPYIIYTLSAIIDTQIFSSTEHKKQCIMHNL